MLRTHPREAAAIHLAGVEGEFQVLRSPPGDSHAPLGVRLLCRKAGLESLPRSNPLGGWLLHAGPQELMDEGVLSLPRQGSPGKLLRQWMWGPSCVSVRSEPSALCSLWLCLHFSSHSLLCGLSGWAMQRAWGVCVTRWPSQVPSAAARPGPLW